MLAGQDSEDAAERGAIPGLVSNGLNRSCTSLGSSSGSSDAGRGAHLTRKTRPPAHAAPVPPTPVLTPRLRPQTGPRDERVEVRTRSTARLSTPPP